MNSLFFPTPLFFIPPTSIRPKSSLLPKIPHLHHHCQHAHHLQPHNLSSKFRSLCTPQPEGTVAVANFEDLLEKDWSFLEPNSSNSPEQQTQEANLIISEGIIEKSSRVLVSIPSEDFVDRLVESSSLSSGQVLVVHDSLFVLCGIKEKYDGVKCWQGELIYVPEKWAPFDVVFLCYFPALPFEIDQIFDAIAKRCSPGARVVISFSQGREVVEQQKKEYPDVVVSDLPSKMTLEKVAADHSFEISRFSDDPGFYLAVLKFCGADLLTE